MNTAPTNFTLLDSSMIKGTKPKINMLKLSGKSDTEFDFLEQDPGSVVAVAVLTHPNLQSGPSKFQLPNAAGIISTATLLPTPTHKIGPVINNSIGVEGNSPSTLDISGDSKATKQPAIYNLKLQAISPIEINSSLLRIIPEHKPAQISKPVSIVNVEPDNIIETMQTAVKADPAHKSVSIQNEASLSGTQTEIRATHITRNIEAITIGIVKISTLSIPDQGPLPTENANTPAPDKIQNINTHSNQPTRTLRLQLLPHNLGTVDIIIHSINGKISVEIETAQAQTETLLRTHLGTLTRSMEMAGLVLEELTIRNNPNSEITQVGLLNLANQAPSNSNEYSQLSRNSRPIFDVKLENATDSSGEELPRNPYREGVYL